MHRPSPFSKATALLLVLLCSLDRDWRALQKPTATIAMQAARPNAHNTLVFYAMETEWALLVAQALEILTELRPSQKETNRDPKPIEHAVPPAKDTRHAPLDAWRGSSFKALACSSETCPWQIAATALSNSSDGNPIFTWPPPASLCFPRRAEAPLTNPL